MSRANLDSSLGAVEQALEHFTRSIDRAGFADGAGAYRQMVDVTLGQWLWADEEGAHEFDRRFLRISMLAGSVADGLRPYVMSMDRLRALRGLVMERWRVEPGSTAERVVDSLLDCESGLTAAELSTATGAPTSAVRTALRELVDVGAVARVRASSARYALAQPVLRPGASR